VLEAEIAARLMALHGLRETVLVAIDGGGGAGKSSLAERLQEALRLSNVPASIVEVDDFFLPSERRPPGVPRERPIGGDFDWQRLREQVLEPLRCGQAARYARYNWAADALSETRQALPGAIVIVEGIYSSRRELADLYDFRIWVDTPRETRLARGLARDGEQARKKWEEDWMPCEDRYILEHRPQDHADAVVNGAAV
jgi:uridine kinase